MAQFTTPGRDTKWADGLRGIASVLVVADHLSRSLTPTIVYPAMPETLLPNLLQLPIIRALFNGRPSIAIFAILLGFVNSLKPIQQVRNDQIDTALSGVGKSAFRRTGRFMIPAMIATLISWFICELGAYTLAKSVESDWIRNTSPTPSVPFYTTFSNLFENLAHTWLDGGNRYDMVQWTLPFLLKGSMHVYLTSVATAQLQSRYRIAAYAAMFYYFWRLGDSLIGINIYAGLILTELHLDTRVHEFASRFQSVFSISSSCLIGIGLFFISFPEEHPEWVAWSNDLLILGQYIFPPGAEFNRFYPALGANLLMFGVLFNSTARRFLSNSFLCYLGKMSLGIYLIHPPLIRSLLTWMIYGFSRQPQTIGKDAEGHETVTLYFIPQTSIWVTLVALPIWFYALYRLAQLWTNYVDPFSARITNWIEEKTFRNDVKVEYSYLMAQPGAMP